MGIGVKGVGGGGGSTGQFAEDLDILVTRVGGGGGRPGSLSICLVSS